MAINRDKPSVSRKRKAIDILSILMLTAIPVFCIEYIFKKELFWVSIAFALGIGVFLAVGMYFVFNLPDILSKPSDRVSTIVNHKKIAKIKSYFESHHLVPAVNGNKLNVTFLTQKVFIRIDLNSIGVFFDFDNQQRKLTNSAITQDENIRQIISHENGLVVYLKKNIPEEYLFDLVANTTKILVSS